MSDSKIKSERKKTPSSHVRFSDNEFKRVSKMKQVTGRSIPDLLRAALLSRMDLERPLLSKEDVLIIMTELRRQGNNINQISKQVNSGLSNGWNQSFNSLVKAYVDIRHLISVNRGLHRA